MLLNKISSVVVLIKAGKLNFRYYVISRASYKLIHHAYIPTNIDIISIISSTSHWLYSPTDQFDIDILPSKAIIIAHNWINVSGCKIPWIQLNSYKTWFQKGRLKIWVQHVGMMFSWRCKIVNTNTHLSVVCYLVENLISCNSMQDLRLDISRSC